LEGDDESAVVVRVQGLWLYSHLVSAPLFCLVAEPRCPSSFRRRALPRSVLMLTPAGAWCTRLRFRRFRCRAGQQDDAGFGNSDPVVNLVVVSVISQPRERGLPIGTAGHAK
jgi:hypothetical protein